MDKVRKPSNSVPSKHVPRDNRYTSNNRTVRRGVFYAVHVVSDTQYAAKEK
jgi:hypothetical protein